MHIVYVVKVKKNEPHNLKTHIPGPDTHTRICIGTHRCSLLDKKMTSSVNLNDCLIPRITGVVDVSSQYSASDKLHGMSTMEYNTIQYNAILYTIA